MTRILVSLALLLLSGAIMAQSTTLDITITTGGDDLRGGNDNANLVVLFADGQQQYFRNINQGGRWKDHTPYSVRYTVNKAIAALRGIRLETTASGGFNGDNWNVNGLKVVATSGGRSQVLLSKSGNYLARFTGDNRVEDFIWGSVAPVSAPAKYTNFNPAVHGFKFSNSFTNVIIGDIKTKGLCGGMSYSALDYYYGRQDIPTQTTQPAEGTPLRKYIYDRQVNSLADNADKWAELIGTNFGNRDQEFFNWGLQAGSGRLGELMRNIDQGRPCPLGLQTTGQGPFSHQVVAVGYKLGRYQGDLGAYQTDVEIYIYDPNYPNQRLTLVPDPAGRCYRIKEKPQNYWRTYFVDQRYRAARPTVAR
ncbi:hypothetical protein QWY85_03560 [Neolewinella lacunae]|uniref:Uncharacterized protein n=1 Tax=Neolewinella lacunae TaxID=1517758 RepID=A0A923PLW6_9BACT|nr:hypothetical protein [Neolewinella lacunae]MBC6992917.1 hypothetical protein [Neolewinella lacunae]MDN3633719.1 hypothetical protein [Neolewinella lacunae]